MLIPYWHDYTVEVRHGDGPAREFGVESYHGALQTGIAFLANEKGSFTIKTNTGEPVLIFTTAG